MKLYEITNEFQQVFNEVDENGELTEQAIAKLDAIGELAENKIMAVASYIKNIDAERAAVSEARKAMTERESRINKRVEWLTNYLTRNMESCGITEISSSPYFTIKLKKCPVSVLIENEEDIDAEFKKEKISFTIDKLKIKENIQAGFEVKGARLIQNNRIEIK